ncbi:MAG: hypothetical protein KGJ35_03545, partial [Patescibacteria group bacterium]|nr:hypothetical protein [Patescibacteria group bacterium]
MSKKTFIPTIGLEIHAELKTASKMFCRCKNDPNEAKPNINICPICLGHPGTLPVLNHEAIRHVIMVGRAIGGTIADYTEWDRKNYFYPDIPKGYQISQYKYPLVSGGMISVQIQGQTSANTRSDLCKYKVGPCTDIAITRLHLEEDTASSIHDAHDTHSLVDFNRSGVPLLELVTEPVIHSAGEAAAFAKELQLLLRTLGVAEANMEKGEMRVEANVSVAEVESTESKVGSKDKEDSGLGAHDFRLKKLGTKTEVKNLNSF